MASHEWILSHQRVFRYLYDRVISILTFVWTCHKCLQRACECGNWHQIIYVHSTGVRHVIFFHRVSSCARRVRISGSLTNFNNALLGCPSRLKVWQTYGPPIYLSLILFFALQVVFFRTHFRRKCNLHGYQGWYHWNEKNDIPVLLS